MIRQLAIMAAAAILPDVALAQGSSQLDPTFNGTLKSVDCQAVPVAVCSDTVCTPIPPGNGQINFNFGERMWQSPPLRGPKGPLKILSVSAPIVGKPLRVDFEFRMDQFGPLRAVLLATPTPHQSSFQIASAFVSPADNASRVIWTASCAVDVFSR